MTKTSKKAQAIFHDTYLTIDNHVRKGMKFDCLSNVCCITRQTVTKHTVKDLEQICKLEFYRVELHIKHYGASHPSIIAREVEVARRMWLTIQRTAKEVEKWGEVLSA